jgi:hypothetical protein
MEAPIGNGGGWSGGDEQCPTQAGRMREFNEALRHWKEVKEIRYHQ